jgi:hypothetical protein
VTCPHCDNKGIIRLNWADAPDDYAVCLCPVGLDLRSTDNNGHAVAPRWWLWAARNHIPLERVFLAEDVLTPEELAERGWLQTQPPVGTVEAKLRAAGNKAKR